MQKFRKKPVVIEAAQWSALGDVPGAPITSWLERCKGSRKTCEQCGHPISLHGECATLEGYHIVCPGDWIIKGVKGEFYPCKPDIFAATYESAEEGERV